MNCFDVAYGWLTVDPDDVHLTNVVEWYWGDVEVSAVQVILADNLTGPAFAQVTVWFRGVGNPVFVADAASLAAYLGKVLPGVQALATQVYQIVEI